MPGSSGKPETRLVAVTTDEHGGRIFVASTTRASRAARPPDPTAEAKELAYVSAAHCAQDLEREGLRRIVRLAPTTYASAYTATPSGGAGSGAARSRSAPGASGGAPGGASTALVVSPFRRDGGAEHLDASVPARPTATLSHVFSLHSRSIDAAAREPAYLSYQCVLPLVGAQLAAAGLRSNSVRNSIVDKPAGAAGSQQTPRINLGEMYSAWAGQAAAVALALGVAKRECAAAATSGGTRFRDPAATNSLDPAVLLESGSVPKTFLMTSSARLLPHALPTRLCAHSFLNTMSAFAQDELAFGGVQRWVPRAQHSAALRSICRSVVDNSDGVNVWASWVLLVFMISDARLRHLISASPISDLEVATAMVFTAYGRAEVTHRARLEETVEAARASKQQKLEEEDEDEEGAPLDYEEEIAATAATAAAASEPPAPPAAPPAPSGGHSALSAKRKRSSGGASAAGAAGAAGTAGAAGAAAQLQANGAPFLEYWDAAFGSKYATVLKTLITRSRAEANAAAVDSLSEQLATDGSRPDNELLIAISTQNAIRSAAAIANLVVTGPDAVPQVVAWRKRTPRNTVDLHVGLVRSSSDAENTSLHACSLAQLPSPGHTRCVWSHAVKNTTPGTAETKLLPGISEAQEHLEAIACGRIAFASRPRMERNFAAIKNRAAQSATDGALPLPLTGVARSFLVLATQLVVGDGAHRAGVAAAVAVNNAAAAVAQEGAFAPRSDVESCALLSSETLASRQIAEPYATPASNLTLALYANEIVRVLMKGKSHRGDPCRHLCGIATPQELSEPSPDEFDKPTGLLVVTDVKCKLLDDAAAPLRTRTDARLRRVCVSLTVCGDHAVRAVDAIRALASDGDAEGARAIALAAAARASELNDAINATTAGYLRTSIASAKRILVNDLNTRPLLTLFQVYRVGVSNVPRSFETTPWSGTYEAGYDIGTSAGIGIGASSLTADKRNHGKLLMEQRQVDEWSWFLARRHYMAVSPTEYAAIPREARGVPHLAIPGLHAYLDRYVEAMARLDERLGTSKTPAVSNLQCLPFGPYSERLPTHVVEGSASTAPLRFRNPNDAVGADGRAFQVDSTVPDVSIMREPFFARPGVTAPTDNPLAQCQPYVTTFFGAAALLATFATTLEAAQGRAPSASSQQAAPKELLRLMRAYVLGPEDAEPDARYAIARDACVVLNAMYPRSARVNEPTIHEAFARAFNQKGSANPDRNLRWLFASGTPAERAWCAEASEWFGRFVRPEAGAWKELAPLLGLLIERDGSFDNGLDDLDAMAEALERAVRGAWYVHSPDGARAPAEPSPLAGVPSATMVMPEHVNPIFVGNADKQPYVHARGSIVGLMPMGWQQLLHTLLGGHCPKVNAAQYVRNEGQLAYRASSAADVRTQGGKDRSAKAISCVGVDGDEQAFGTRSEKLVMCRLQRAAWTANLDLVKGLCLIVAPPRSKEARGKGCRAAVEFMKTRRLQYSAVHTHTQQELDASRRFAECVAKA